ncbi:hypothetical protein NSA19_01080 [Actinomyces bowdenii]|uniref:hypothetical protein n=1 Tax=Actinomyces bowdenii TaxID=131109 RepID=UPI00214AB121|nr:hypothetical protein [Actinomyces bowdenii]MCR2051470.1 hypothetical protein [Actinomyces bowdenii]
MDDAIEWAQYYAPDSGNARVRVIAAAYLERCGFQTDAEEEAAQQAMRDYMLRRKED